MTILHLIGEWLRNTLLFIPRPAVRALFVALPVVVLVWVLLLPRRRAVEHRSDPWMKDLRIWASIALIIQIAIYALV